MGVVLSISCLSFFGKSFEVWWRLSHHARCLALSSVFLPSNREGDQWTLLVGFTEAKRKGYT